MTEAPALQHGSGKGYGFGATTEGIIGAAIEVHKELGPGFQEVVYQRALDLELKARGIEASREENVPVFYKGVHVDTRRVDFVVEDCIVEIKARSAFLPEDFIQTLSYLKASRFRVALLINFGAEKLEVKRLINERGRHAGALSS
jgi:GxxExxY protein